MKRLMPLLALVAASCATGRPAPLPPVPPAPAPIAAPVSKPAIKPTCQARVKRDVDRYADLDAATAADVFQQVAALKRGIAQRDAREKKLEAALRSCGGMVR